MDKRDVREVKVGDAVVQVHRYHGGIPDRRQKTKVARLTSKMIITDAGGKYNRNTGYEWGAIKERGIGRSDWLEVA